MAEEISKSYDPALFERPVYRRWVEARAFAAEPDGRRRRYVIMMPLPNVTGALHMGHAMDNVMQDLLVRWHRMMGDNTLWMPGTDHAGIATQAVVEKRLFELEGKNRYDLGREGLVKRIWEWKEQYQRRIIEQLQMMGCSCDWDRQRFTMDAVCTAAVRATFFRLFRDGLIYQGERIVNWDCHLQTAVSDDEIVRETVQGHFWHIRYPIIDPKPGEPDHVTVATTRPETMLGDTAVAVHPDPGTELEKLTAALRRRLEAAPARERPELEAELARVEKRRATHLPRLQRLVWMAREKRQVLLPLQERPIPLILDEWARPELGSGCVKITPAHDPNDFDVWTRHREEFGALNILLPNGSMSAAAGAYAGLDRFEARRRVVVDLEARGLVEAVEDREIEIGHSDRSKTPIEPYLSRQWFVRMGDVEGGVLFGKGTPGEFRASGLAQAAIDAVAGGWRTASGRRLRFHPDHERYSSTYLNWLAEKRDWCISRQLWWGHRIPIWLGSLDAERVRKLLLMVSEAGGNGSGPGLALRVAHPEGRILSPAEMGFLDGGGPYPVQVCLRDEQAEADFAPLLEGLGLARDPDVLDTWFSSALWPHSTLGWPDPQQARVGEGQSLLGSAGGAPDCLAYYYPGSCLVTARDIITLWVARMVIMGLYNLGDVPFTDSFIHANIQDGKGERMAKSKGNGIDPAEIIGRYGTDAMRYVLCDMQTGTQDIRLPVTAICPRCGHHNDLAATLHGSTIFTYICGQEKKKVFREGSCRQEFDVLGTIPALPQAALISDRFDVGRAFCNKLWNAARFVLMNLGEHPFRPVSREELAGEDRWILSRLRAAIAGVSGALAAYNPAAALGIARGFFWGELCDWYLEMIKPRLRDEESAPVARSVLAVALDQVLRLLHPFVPFITEALWERLGEQAPVRGLAEPLPGCTSEIMERRRRLEEHKFLVTEPCLMLIHAPWPEHRLFPEEPQLEAEIGLVQEMIKGIRDLRWKYDVPPGKNIVGRLKAGSKLEEGVFTFYQPHIERLSSGTTFTEISVTASPPPLAASQVVARSEVYLEGVLNPDKERTRLEKQRQALAAQIAASEAKLANEKFVSRAKPEVVATERQRLEEARGQLAAVEKHLRQLDAPPDPGWAIIEG